MKLVSFSYNKVCSIGVFDSSTKSIVDIHKLSKGKLPNNMLDYLKDFKKNNINLKILLKDVSSEFYLKSSDIVISPPLPNPVSFRDAYAFRRHVEAGRRNRGLDMIPEYDHFPVFYFSNHNSITGPGAVSFEKEHFKKLDFEFEIAAVISKHGKNIKCDEADDYIAGFVIMNDWSERDIQLKEMKLNLGPAKGKDFATSIGPFLVTLDELDDVKIDSNLGAKYDLNMNGYINGKLVSNDNFKNITWSFAQIIERISHGTDIFPGDLIGSGTCATGCLLELNLTHNNNEWLKVNDEIKLEVDRLGVLSNRISLKK